VTQDPSAYVPNTTEMLSQLHLGSMVSACNVCKPIITQVISPQIDHVRQDLSLYQASGAHWVVNPLIGRECYQVNNIPGFSERIAMTGIANTSGLSAGLLIYANAMYMAGATRYMVVKVYDHPSGALIGSHTFQPRYNNGCTIWGGLVRWPWMTISSHSLLIECSIRADAHPVFYNECRLISNDDYNALHPDVIDYLTGFGPYLTYSGWLTSMCGDLILNDKLPMTDNFYGVTGVGFGTTPVRARPNWIMSPGYEALSDPGMNDNPFCVEAMLNIQNVQYVDVTVFGSIALDTPERALDPATLATYTLPDGRILSAAELINAVDFSTKPSLQVIGCGVKRGGASMGSYYPLIYTTDVQHIKSEYKTVGTILASPIRGLDFSGSCSITTDGCLILYLPIPKLVTPWNSTAGWGGNCHMFASVRMKVIISANAELTDLNLPPVSFRGCSRTVFDISQTEFSLDVENRYLAWLSQRVVPIT